MQLLCLASKEMTNVESKLVVFVVSDVTLTRFNCWYKWSPFTLFFERSANAWDTNIHIGCQLLNPLSDFHEI
jgi:hypothetical protein